MPETDERRKALADLARGAQVNLQQMEALRKAGWVEDVPAISWAGREVLEKDGNVPKEWVYDE